MVSAISIEASLILLVDAIFRPNKLIPGMSKVVMQPMSSFSVYISISLITAYLLGFLMQYIIMSKYDSAINPVFIFSRKIP